MKILLLSVLLILCAASVNAESENLLAKIKNLFKSIFDGMKELWTEVAGQLKEKIKSFGEMTTDMFELIKERIYDYIDEMSASESQKEELKHMVEKMEMEQLKDIDE